MDKVKKRSRKWKRLKGCEKVWKREGWKGCEQGGKGVNRVEKSEKVKQEKKSGNGSEKR